MLATFDTVKPSPWQPAVRKLWRIFRSSLSKPEIYLNQDNWLKLALIWDKYLQSTARTSSNKYLMTVLEYRFRNRFTFLFASMCACMCAHTRASIHPSIHPSKISIHSSIHPSKIFIHPSTHNRVARNVTRTRPTNPYAHVWTSWPLSQQIGHLAQRHLAVARNFVLYGSFGKLVRMSELV